MRTWGETGTVKIRTDTDPKLKETSGVVCVMIGYPNQHSGDTYQMFDPVSRRVYVTRDVQWLGRMYWIKHEDAIDDNYYSIETMSHEVSQKGAAFSQQYILQKVQRNMEREDEKQHQKNLTNFTEENVC
jgi:hypothetical protein